MTFYFIVCANGQSLEVNKEEFDFCLDRHESFKVIEYPHECVGWIVEYFTIIKTSSGYRRNVFAYLLKC